MSKKMPNTNDPPRIHIKALFNCEVIYAMHPCQGDLVAIECAVVCYDRVPTQLVQEFNVGTVTHRV